MEINEEKLKEILKEQRKEFQDYIGVISEDFKSEVKLVAEVLTGQQEQLSAIKDMIAKNTEAIIVLQGQVIAMRDMIVKNTEAISSLQVQVKAMQEMIIKNTESIKDFQIQVISVRKTVAENTKDTEIIKNDTQFIKQNFKQKVDRDEFNFLEKRVLALENKI